jgi:DNA-binding transcriptional LysR family regulator
VDLFVRLPRRLELTDQGERFLGHARLILAAVEEAGADIQHSRDELEGRLSIGVATEFGTSLIGPIIQEFAHLHTSLDFEVEILSQSHQHFNHPDIDCLIHLGHPPDSQLIGRKIWNFRFSLYAGADYLQNKGTPANVDALQRHQRIQYLPALPDRSPQPWQLRKGQKDTSLSPISRMHSSDFWMVKYFAVTNLGIAYLPDFFVNTECRMKALAPVLPEWKSNPVPVYALYPKHRHGSRKVNAFIDLWLHKINQIEQIAPYALVQPGNPAPTKTTSA